MPESACSHVGLVGNPPALTPDGCEDCLAAGTAWVHLRRCLTCGHIGCCDSSPGRHATVHFQSTGHPLIQSFQPGESLRWCYVDNLMLP